MRIYVCVKHVPDTAARITVAGGAGFAETCKFIVNPYDEYAVEEAVQLVKKAGGGEVVVVTVGKEAAAASMRAALALGAQRGILVKTDAQFLDSRTTSLALKKAIERDGAADIILTGKQSVDSEGMQTPYRLAQALGMPVVSDVQKLTVEGRTAVVEREIDGGGREVVELGLPCVIGATRGLNEPHYPKLPEILQAKKKEIKVIALAELGLGAGEGCTEIIKLEATPERGQARMLEGSTREKVEQLVSLLIEKERVF
jgi:electron transfer flavoprotein beta subunit